MHLSPLIKILMICCGVFFTLRLATVREGEEPTRRRTPRFYEKSSRGLDWSVDVTGRPLTAEQERSLRPNGLPFKECTSCPEMVVLPAGEFMMGLPPSENPYAVQHEVPLHRVTIDRPFAIARFELTFDEWDACAAHADCYRKHKR
jgi:hypothetical protein